MTDPIVDWYDQLHKREGFQESTLLVTVAQRLSLAHEQAMDVDAVIAEAGVVDESTKKALKLLAKSLVNYVQSEAECSRQILLAEIRGVEEYLKGHGG